MPLNHRAIVQFDAARSLFVAIAPELSVSGEGATRAEAVAQLEDALAALAAGRLEQGEAVPPALDDEGAPAGEEAAPVAVSASLRRQLAFQARVEGVPPEQLAGEILAEGLALRAFGGRRPSAAAAPAGAPREGERRRDDTESGRGFRRERGARYQAIMEDKATFLEYVRGLDQGQPRPGGGRSGPPPRRDRGRPGGQGGQGGQGGPGGPGGRGGGPGPED